MSLLVRKINKAKWYSESREFPIPACADSITLCLKTSKNTLSFWNIEKEENIEEAVLAIAASNDSLDTIDVVVIAEEELVKRGFKINATPGDTACSDLVDAHRDLADLNVKHLDMLSEIIVTELNDGKVRRYTFAGLKKLLAKAIDDGRILLDDLKDGVRNKVVPQQSAAPAAE